MYCIETPCMFLRHTHQSDVSLAVRAQIHLLSSVPAAWWKSTGTETVRQSE